MTSKVRTNAIFRDRRLAFAGLVLAMLTITACGRSSVQAAPAMPAPLVTVVKATAQDVPKYLDEIGRNAAFESVTVTPQVAGRITERHFQDGENLRAGQLLFVIDPRPYKAQVDLAQATLAQAKAALDLAKIQFARDQEVIGTKAISQQDYDTKKNAVDVDQAQVGGQPNRRFQSAAGHLPLNLRQIAFGNAFCASRRSSMASPRRGFSPCCTTRTRRTTAT
ncbi:MAG: biotin/lipoyl-binding protein [Candidatus Korobacteraceae bacterium]